MSALQVYNSLLPLTKEDSLMSIHYAKYAYTGCRAEYIGRKRRSDCIKRLQVDWERERERRWSTLSTSFLSFSPDGTQTLSNAERGVCVREATSGKLVAGPLAGDDKCNALTAAYSPDGRLIIVASEDGIIRKWDVLTNYRVWEKKMGEKQIDLSRVVSAEFSPDRKSVAFGYQKTILVWDVETGRRSGESLEGHTDSIGCLSFSPDGERLTSGSDDMTIMIWDVNGRKVKTGPLKKHTQRVTAVSFSPSGSSVVSGSLDGTILIWNAITGEVFRKIICVNKVFSVTYSPDGRLILAGGQRWMSMWDVNVIAASKVFRVDSNSIWGVSFSPDSTHFVCGSCWSNLSDDLSGGMIQIWDASLEETDETPDEQRVITCTALSSHDGFIATGSYNGSIYLWELSGKIIKRFKHSHRVHSVVFSPNIHRTLVVFGSDDKTVRLWDVTTNESITIGNHTNWVSSVAFSPSAGTYVASGSADHTICIWDVELRDLAVGPLTGHKDRVQAVAFSPDGTSLVSGSADNTVRIWNSVTGDLLSTLNNHSNWVNSVAYSFDGSRIVSGSDDKTIIVWDAQSGQIVCGPIKGHDNWVHSVCFSPDGERILSGSEDNTARVWDAKTGESLFPPFRGHMGAVESVHFFPDKIHFATGSEDGTIRKWTLEEIPNDVTWRLKDSNRVVGENGNLMMWIPTDLRRYLCGHRNISILNRSFYVKLHFGTEQNTSRNIQL